MSLHELAMAAAELTKQPPEGQGVSVFPVPGCAPRDAVDRPRKAYRLFMAHPTAQFIAVPMGAPSMIVAIAVEATALGWLRHSFARFPATRVHRTPDGGYDLLYKMPLPPIPILTCNYGKLARGVDVLGDGGSVVWPASAPYQDVTPGCTVLLSPAARRAASCRACARLSARRASPSFLSARELASFISASARSALANPSFNLSVSIILRSSRATLIMAVSAWYCSDISFNSAFSGKPIAISRCRNSVTAASERLSRSCRRLSSFSASVRASCAALRARSCEAISTAFHPVVSHELQRSPARSRTPNA